MYFRNIQKNDYEDIIKLLQQLTECSYDKDNYENYIENLPNNQHHIVLEKDGKLIASGVLVIECKIIHNFKNVGHIEDIIVDKKYRCSGIGKKLIHFLIQRSKDMNCYKVILNCDQKLQKFYEICGFKDSGTQMSIYF